MSSKVTSFLGFLFGVLAGLFLWGTLLATHYCN